MAYEKILVIALHKHGDNVQVTPLFKALKELYPGAHLACLVEKGYSFAFENNPHIDEMVLFDRTNPALARQCITNGEFSLVINRQSSAEGADLASLARSAKIRGVHLDDTGSIVIDDPWTRLLFALVKNRRINPFNLVDYGLHVAGAHTGERRLDLYFDPHTADAYAALLRARSEGPLLAVQAGSQAEYRKWPAQSFLQAIKRLLLRGPCTVALLGSSEDYRANQEIVAAIPGHLRARVIDTSGIVTLPMLPALLKKCGLLITNDTGPMHIAAAAGCKVLALYFGGSFLSETGPYSPGNLILCGRMDCLPCAFGHECKKAYACKEMVLPDQVAELAAYGAGMADTVNEKLFAQGMVYCSPHKAWDQPLVYLPFFRTRLGSDELTRLVLYGALSSALLHTPIDVRVFASRIAACYTNARQAFNAPFSVPLDLFHPVFPHAGHLAQFGKTVVETMEALRSALAAVA
ncbi:MAG: hypothetical protein A2268_04560 [Candidatus Raymondbacteria bacterium RifOxyA12_full_50_37]|nr:MAG: hypothetical protein A2268_04560 [Candidatus Raymondbacteria bacterium RifOxyA12_full_50_37]OGJ94023.1 MAG: hypothetical protein A2248_11760 [Candidatus Raymondbacteria bacterium RIFOXYA2_FULL_49_16]OGJ96849.1 MAG: hypothetical protein A2453_04365 [Candidatus Raymondbacteria bacterium RIFOXYC2_FULL_50_21]OGP41771.1 MAG: hypothetical protein A2324_18135 [Candidatus Raymondbacteria bacterium RIFOXYB2_FULL_49_35]